MSQSWIEGPNLPNFAEGRHHPITFSIEKNGYVGLGSSPNAYTDEFYKYNSETNIWTEIKKFPGGGRSFAIGISHNGKAYLGFGLDARGNYLNDIWEFDPVTESWVKLTDCPCVARTHPSLLAFNNKLYVGLGGSPNGDLKDWWEYDLNNKLWERKMDIPGKPRHHPFQFVIPPYLYAGMGHGGPIIYNDLYRFDPAKDEWVEMKSLPSQGRVAGTQFNFNGRGYVLSGQGGDHDYLPKGEFWEYNAELNDWKELLAHPGVGRWAPGSFVIGNKVYFTCGQDSDKFNNDLWIYDFTVLNSTSTNEKLPTLYFISKDELLLRSATNELPQVYDLMGNNVSSKLQIEWIEDQVKINTSLLSSGLYLIKINSLRTQKFLKT